MMLPVLVAKVFGILERKASIGIYLYDSPGRVNHWDLMISHSFYCNCVKHIYEKYWINIEEIMKKTCSYYNCKVVSTGWLRNVHNVFILWQIKYII